MNALKWSTLLACFLIFVVFLDFLFSTGISCTKYQYDIELSGYRCGSTQTVFEIDNVSDSFACGKLCHHYKVCQSFFYQPDSRMCIGCSFLWRWFHSKDSGDRLNGSQFYFKPLTTFSSANRNWFKERYAWLYKGKTIMTKDKLECRRWEHFSNNTIWTKDFKLPDSSLSEANNYCRNPQENDQPWCYTDGNKSWNYCDIKQCPNDYCYEDVSRNYQGQIAITETGTECQRWDSTYPHRHSYGSMASKFPDNSVSDAVNYCRDPSSSGRPW